jgi:tetratricopeptide (TPR) repeat protein
MSPLVRKKKNGRQRWQRGKANILVNWGRLDEAMALYKKQEAICIELGNRDSLQISYGNQALILQVWGRLDEAMALTRKRKPSASSSATAMACNAATPTRRSS